jgi:hypothetical protein
MSDFGAPPFNSSHAPFQPGAAVCAVHMQNTASGTCARCGNYVCYQCTDSGRFTTCEACRARTGVTDFPISRDTFSIGGVLDAGWTAFSENWLMLTLGPFILAVVNVAFSFCSNILTSGMQAALEDVDMNVKLAVTLVISFSISLVSIVVQGGLTLGLVRMALDAVDRKPVELSALFSQFRKLLKWAVQIIVIGVAMAVPMALVFAPMGIAAALDKPEIGSIVTIVLMLLLIVPFFYVSLGLSFLNQEIVYDDSVGAIDSIKRSWQIAGGFRLSIFVIGPLGALIMIGGVLVCCVGVFPAQGLVFAFMAATYRALRNGSGLPDPVAAPKNF